jgi:hypothetical protein
MDLLFTHPRFARFLTSIKPFDHPSKSQQYKKLPGKIISLAKLGDKESLSKALFLARFGVEFNRDENEQLADFYIYHEEMKRINAFKPPVPVWMPEYEKEIEKTVQHLEEKIAKIFLDAVKAHDGEKIKRLANAVWFWQGKISSDYFAPDADKELFRILLLKNHCRTFEKQITVREVAEHLAAQAGRKFVPSPDGFKSLRRKLQAIDFPIAKAKRG